MCGIAGIVQSKDTVTQEMLAPMAEALRHRGPDDSGFYTEAGVGLAHTRLSIIDVAGGHQPIVGADGQRALVANGEIYNYLELREELGSRGAAFQTHSDSEVIIHAYEHYGERFVERLNGMFAFGLYDRARGKLLLVRDRLGIKPLFYASTANGLVFGSEIKALLPTLTHAPAVEPGALVQFLQNQFATGRDTVLQGIHRVLPGEVLTVDTRTLTVETRRYWSALDVVPRDIDQEQAQAEFDELMDSVLTEHARSDVPYGLFLSGGVDSGVLAATVPTRAGRLRSFSVGFKDARQADELDDAERIAARFDTEHTSLRLSKDDLFGHIPLTIWAADDLMRDYASLPTAALAQAASDELKVVFTGEGGDEAFAGYGRYKPRLERSIKRLIAPGSGGFRTRGQWRRARAKQVFSRALREAPSPRSPFVAAWQATPPQWSDAQRSQYTDLTTALPDNLLVKVDRMLMAFGVEGRVPFLDHRVVEFGLSLPDRLKFDRGQGKVFLKQWARRHLPDEHLFRKKRGFHVPVGEWLQGPFLDRLADKLLHNEAIAEWFDREAVRALIEARRTKGGGTIELWCLMQFAIWHYLFIERPGARPSSQEDPLAWMS